MGFTISSPAFSDGAEIPIDHTCEGHDRAPPLAWRGAPAGTRSLALIVDDPDAPDPAAPKRTWVHWVVVDLPPDSAGLDGAVPAGARVGLNDWKKPAWGGPCPPIGRHRYFFKLYALDVALGLDRPTKAEVELAMAGHVLAEAQLVGTYQKQK
jgi:Raf kinase inhibitor-like YbhB/YbcL family protein